jgi:glucuronate isomerase
MYNDFHMLKDPASRKILEELETLPIFDMHTHVDLSLVLANRLPPDPWTALCAGDHYIASLLETLGAMDRQTFHDPQTDPCDKWTAYASVFPFLLGNPVRDWMRMTLESFGLDEPLNPENARSHWDTLAALLNEERFRPVSLFKTSPVTLIATTDNPVDSLQPIEHAAEIFGEGYWVPTWRPDPFLHLNPSPMAPRTWRHWLDALEKVVGRELKGQFSAFLEALAERHQHFANHGCRASDYGVRIPAGHTVSTRRAATLFDKACRGKPVTDSDALDFQAFLMRHSMELDFDAGWVSQIHYGPARNQRAVAAHHGGLDSGCDTIDGLPALVDLLHDLLNHFDTAESKHHKIVMYSSRKTDWELVAGLSRIFPSVYTGMAWWYHDSVPGILEFLNTVPEIGAGLRKIGPFVTDTRNIYSLMPRTRMFRRCLATILGGWVEFRNEPLEEARRLAKSFCTRHVEELLGISRT